MLVLQLCMSALTIYVMFAAGSKKRSAWAIALLNQALWCIYIWKAHAYGLIPLNVVLTVVYARNLILWRNPFVRRP